LAGALSSLSLPLSLDAAAFFFLLGEVSLAGSTSRNMDSSLTKSVWCAL
jgi:hypothetical protein